MISRLILTESLFPSLLIVLGRGERPLQRGREPRLQDIGAITKSEIKDPPHRGTFLPPVGEVLTNGFDPLPLPPPLLFCSFSFCTSFRCRGVAKLPGTILNHERENEDRIVNRPDDRRRVGLGFHDLRTT